MKPWWCSIVLHPFEEVDGYMLFINGGIRKYQGDLSVIEAELKLPRNTRFRLRYVTKENGRRAVVFLCHGRTPSVMDNDWHEAGYYHDDKAKEVALSYVRMLT